MRAFSPICILFVPSCLLCSSYHEVTSNAFSLKEEKQAFSQQAFTFVSDWNFSGLPWRAEPAEKLQGSEL